MDSGGTDPLAAFHKGLDGLERGLREAGMLPPPPPPQLVVVPVEGVARLRARVERLRERFPLPEDRPRLTLIQGGGGDDA